MRKLCTTVHLEPRQAEELRALSARTGTPQAQAIRAGIDKELADRKAAAVARRAEEHCAAPARMPYERKAISGDLARLRALVTRYGSDATLGYVIASEARRAR